MLAVNRTIPVSQCSAPVGFRSSTRPTLCANSESSFGCVEIQTLNPLYFKKTYRVNVRAEPRNEWLCHNSLKMPRSFIGRWMLNVGRSSRLRIHSNQLTPHPSSPFANQPFDVRCWMFNVKNFILPILTRIFRKRLKFRNSLAAVNGCFRFLNSLFQRFRLARRNKSRRRVEKNHIPLRSPFFP